ncbi:MAG: DUF3870 domain-containing protein [Planctomycetota bacterium]|jgi:hypothetical protein
MSKNYSSKLKGHKLSPNTIVISGSAKLPENSVAKHVLGLLTIELEIDLPDTKVVDVSCILVPSLGERMLRTVLVGNTFDAGIRDAVEQLDKRFFNVTKRAVIAALEDASKCYRRAIREKPRT